jgi:hypothetical protein
VQDLARHPRPDRDPERAPRDRFDPNRRPWAAP